MQAIKRGKQLRLPPAVMQPALDLEARLKRYCTPHQVLGTALTCGLREIAALKALQAAVEAKAPEIGDIHDAMTEAKEAGIPEDHPVVLKAKDTVVRPSAALCVRRMFVTGLGQARLTLEAKKAKEKKEQVAAAQSQLQAALERKEVRLFA